MRHVVRYFGAPVFSVVLVIILSLPKMTAAYSPADPKCNPDNYEMRLHEADYVIAAKFLKINKEYKDNPKALGEFEVIYNWKGDVGSHILLWLTQPVKINGLSAQVPGAPVSEKNKNYLLMLKRDIENESYYVPATCTSQLLLESLQITNERIARINNYFLNKGDKSGNRK